MAKRVERRTVDLSAYPDLVVIYLGQRAKSLRGFRTLIGFGNAIGKAVAEKPDGLLCHENIWYSFIPPHGGMRQYWRDFDALETWSRSFRTEIGGSASCATPEAPASGTRPTS